MNKILTIVLFILVLLAAFFAGGMTRTDGPISSDPSLKMAKEVIGNPIVTHITLEGKVVARDSGSVTLEKDGKQLKVYFTPSSTFMKMGKPVEFVDSTFSSTPSAAIPIVELPVDSEVMGGATIQKDDSTSEYKIYTANFLVK